MKVAERPWVGRYDNAIRSYGVTPADSGFLKDVYGTGIVDLYRKYADETFPVAYGSKDLISFPVDADLRESDHLVVGAPDGDSRDVVLQAPNGETYVGGHYLGGSFPPGFHTWSVKTPGRSHLKVTYHHVGDDPPDLTIVCLKALHLAAQHSTGKLTAFELQTMGPEAIFSIYCPTGTYIVDAMKILRHP